MNPLRRRLRERCADVLDWIDYRPEASFWPFFLVPPTLAAAWAYIGSTAFGIVFAAAFLATLAVALVAGLSLAIWVAARVALDVVGITLIDPRIASRDPVRKPQSI